MSILGWNFFALSSVYKKVLLDEIFYLVKQGFNYSDLMIMPTYERKYFLGKVIESFDQIREANEKQ
jgi:hypothetical protein